MDELINSRDQSKRTHYDKRGCGIIPTDHSYDMNGYNRINKGRGGVIPSNSVDYGLQTSTPLNPNTMPQTLGSLKHPPAQQLGGLNARIPMLDDSDNEFPSADGGEVIGRQKQPTAAATVRMQIGKYSVLPVKTDLCIVGDTLRLFTRGRAIESILVGYVSPDFNTNTLVLSLMEVVGTNPEDTPIVKEAVLNKINFLLFNTSISKICIGIDQFDSNGLYAVESDTISSPEVTAMLESETPLTADEERLVDKAIDKPNQAEPTKPKVKKKLLGDKKTPSSDPNLLNLAITIAGMDVRIRHIHTQVNGLGQLSLTVPEQATMQIGRIDDGKYVIDLSEIFGQTDNAQLIQLLLGKINYVLWGSAVTRLNLTIDDFKDGVVVIENTDQIKEPHIRAALAKG